MKCKFSFEERHSAIFGKIRYPVAIVNFWSNKINRWVKIKMLIDSGADYTILPRYMAKDLGVDIEKDGEQFATEGIGGKETVYLIRDYRVKIGDIELKIPVGFLERDSIPPLLGRQEFMEDLKIVFEKHVTEISA